MSKRLVVAGAGIAGLLAAAASKDEFDDIVVVERDRAFTGSDRRGAHTMQLHNILTRGQQHLEEVLPGFGELVRSRGGVHGSVADDTHVWEFGGRAVERPLGLSILSATWEMIWSTIRDLLPASVQVRFGATVDALVLDDNSVRAVDVDAGGSMNRLDADAVVDATGYTTRFDGLLAAAGSSAPPITHTDIDRWFVTQRFERPARWHGSSDFWMVFDDPPARDVALLSPLADDRWVLSVSSQGLGPAPRSLDEIFQFLRRLPGDDWLSILEGARPDGQPSYYRRAQTRWRHLDQVERPVCGLAAIGEAYATLNPVFGQGVSLAAWQAATMRSALSADHDDGAAWSHRYLEETARRLAHCWMLDQVPVPLLSWDEWARFAPRMAVEADLQRRYVGIWHLLEAPHELLDMSAAAADHGRTDDRRYLG